MGDVGEVAKVMTGLGSGSKQARLFGKRTGHFLTI
jgi:hypothetical protein